jgi:hypothetical protein
MNEGELDRATSAATAPLIRGILAGLNREVVDQLDRAKLIRHPGESGRARENVVADALRRFIPETFGVGNGFVIDATGQQSRQQDIVVYRRGYHPIFFVGGVAHYMVESVAAVIQNKAKITTKRDLLDALDTIASVKALDRTNRGKNYVVHGSNRGENLDAGDYRYQVWGAIVTEASLNRKTLGPSIVAYLGAHEPRLWPNLYVDVNGSVGLYKFDDGTSDVPRASAQWAVTEPEKNVTEAVAPFVEFFGHLANYLRIAPLVDYSPTEYLPRYAGWIEHWPIAAPPTSEGNL